MKRIIAASQNEHKIKEIEAITKEFGMEIISRHDAGIADIDIEEDGVTFEENSYKKAYEIMKLSGEITIADDSGIVVDCLGDAPGVYSARYAGFDGNDEANNKKLRESIKGVPFEKCTARFVSVITIVYPDGDTIVAKGEIEGHVIPEERGSNGFGYDPLFIPLGYDRTFEAVFEDVRVFCNLHLDMKNSPVPALGSDVEMGELVSMLLLKSHTFPVNFSC